ncbi:MAG TPA: dipeptide/oligopeptide/nickel ABC transporter permease/ATP-binding protein [Microbacterium sp.]|uniref:dipeptide/oligopeptide/nickel ABC transporter permease/ATP-binding protein n=1 Tax=Microbacterium sp. TaxID=51671 RepID=UPI002B93ED8B|nr:dipeptide/oligopeptide/nickel ABC transporter permease/ATP-binding protein [Microbacterium sp.]HWI31985.1 dipeptide/oligopeptide/nickel ABC transporter permease/ATP-binding protein [Microbacterium sp.]
MTSDIAAVAEAASTPRTRRRPTVNPLAAVAALIIITVTILVALAEWIAPYDPLQQDLTAILQLPSAAHWLGTDTLGRDTLSRLLFGGQPALTGALTALVIFALIGIVFGILAGYLGGWVDRAVSTVVDLMMSLPGIIIVLAVLAVFSQNLYAAMITAGIIAAGSLVRVVRSSVLAIREELYVAAARISGIGPARIMGRHILPGLVGPVSVQLALFAGGALALQTGLGFLGLATTPPAPSWGGMVGEAAPVMFQAPFFLFVTGGTITLLTLAFGLLGDGIRDFNEGRTRGQAFASPERRTPVAQPEALTGEAPLLRVENYSVSFQGSPPKDVVRGISFTVDRGEIVGLVGESGSGKTVTGLSLLGLLPHSAMVSSGGAWLDAAPLTAMSKQQMRAVRGKRIGLVSQEPMAALDPLFTIGSQMNEVLSRLTTLRGGARTVRARELLAQVGLAGAEEILRKYPHELSGGMLQRIAIAIALAGEPDLIIADEPTTALDVTVQAGILELLRSLREQRGLAVLMITHDLAVVADICDRVLVMRDGEIVERADVDTLFAAPSHEYTATLIRSTPTLVEIP